MPAAKDPNQTKRSTRMADRLHNRLEKLDEESQRLGIQLATGIRQQLDSKQELLQKRLEIRQEMSVLFELQETQEKEKEEARPAANSKATRVQEFFSKKKAALTGIDKLGREISKAYHEFVECETGLVTNLKETATLCQELETLTGEQPQAENNQERQLFEATLGAAISREAELAKEYVRLSMEWETLFERLGRLLEEKEAEAENPVLIISSTNDSTIDISEPEQKGPTSKKARNGVRPLSEKVSPSNLTISPVEDANSEELMQTLSSAFYYATREALSLNTFEKKEDSPWPTAILNKGGARGHAQLMPPVVENQPLMPPEDVERWVQIMWRQREELSDLDADALDLLCHFWLKQATKPEDSAVAVIDEFLELRGLQKKQSGSGRRGGYTPEQRTEMLRALSHIQSIWLNLGEVELYEEEAGNSGENELHQEENRADSAGFQDTTGAEEKNSYKDRGERAKRRRQSIKKAMQSRAFVVTDRLGQLQLDGYMDVERFIYQPGKLFGHFLFGPGRQTAMLSAKAIQYDRYRQRWEKRLARYFSWQWRIQSKRGDYSRPYRVDTLIKASGEELDLRRPSETRNRLEKALDRLQEDGVIASWQYDRWEEKVAEQRGWAEAWLQATVILEPPESIQEAYKTIEYHPAQNKLKGNSPGAGSELIGVISSSSSTKVPDLGEQLKKRRKELGLSQSQAAEDLEISQSQLSRLEKNLVKPSPELEKKIQKWLMGL